MQYILTKLCFMIHYKNMNETKRTNIIRSNIHNKIKYIIGPMVIFTTNLTLLFFHMLLCCTLLLLKLLSGIAHMIYIKNINEDKIINCTYFIHGYCRNIAYKIKKYITPIDYRTNDEKIFTYYNNEKSFDTIFYNVFIEIKVKYPQLNLLNVGHIKNSNGMEICFKDITNITHGLVFTSSNDDKLMILNYEFYDEEDNTKIMCRIDIGKINLKNIMYVVDKYVTQGRGTNGGDKGYPTMYDILTNFKFYNTKSSANKINNAQLSLKSSKL